MARILPDGWEALDFTGSAQREIETLRRLATLPDDCTVLHGVHWTRIEHGCSIYGEIDFVVVAPNGRILLIEQKSGFLDETPDGLVKVHGSLRKKVASHILRSIDALTVRFAQTRRNRPGTPAADTHLSIDYLLYCPDYQVRDAGRAGIAIERIVDASRASQLVALIVDLVTPTPVAGCADAATALRFFSDELSMVADVGTLIGRTDAWVTRLAGGLAQTALHLEFSPVPAARARHRRIRQDAARVARPERRGGGRPVRALPLLQPAARRPRRAHRARRRDGRDLPSLRRPAAARARRAARLRDPRPVRAARGRGPRCAAGRSRALRRADRRRRAGLHPGLARRGAALRPAGRARLLARGSVAEPVRARSGGARRMGDAEGRRELPQPPRHRRCAGAVADPRRERADGRPAAFDRGGESAVGFGARHHDVARRPRPRRGDAFDDRRHDARDHARRWPPATSAATSCC